MGNKELMHCNEYSSEYICLILQKASNILDKVKRKERAQWWQTAEETVDQ